MDALLLKLTSSQLTYTSPSGSMPVTADEVLEAGELAIERGSWVLSGAAQDQGK